MSGTAPSRALILDVDGVISPIRGHTAWGDDVVAGEVFGPVVVSPTLCRRLDQLAELPGVQAFWLTSWPRHLRHRMKPFPGPAWPQIGGGPGDADSGWWKWAALLRWLDRGRGAVDKLAWCDDHLTDRHLCELGPDEVNATTNRPAREGPMCGLAVIHSGLERRGIDAFLLAPRTSAGLTPDQLDRLESFLAPA